MFEKDQILEELKNGICCVTFTKQNGEERVMNCTLSSNYLPEAKEPSKVRSDIKTDAIRIYDIDSEGWRSFNVCNVKDFKFISI